MTEEQRFRLAAKACGKDLTGWNWDEKTQQLILWGLNHKWNPRDDDGDNRRMQVDAEIDLRIHKSLVQSYAEAEHTGFFVEGFREFFGDFPHAATRLAVINCAVAVGEAMG